MIAIEHLPANRFNGWECMGSFLNWTTHINSGAFQSTECVKHFQNQRMLRENKQKRNQFTFIIETEYLHCKQNYGTMSITLLLALKC